MIAKTYNYGLALFLDGQIQSAEDDEALYHELLVQPAMLRHPSPKDVLILGGGEGATLREVLVHESVRSATMVDLDGELVDLCRQYLDTFHMGAFDDPRGRLIIGDGRAFLEQDQNLYDVIIVDLVDMIEDTQISRLYTVEFYQLVRQRLRPGGIVAVQGLEFSFLDDEAHAAVARTLRAVFAEVHSYRAHIPSFLAGWGFMWASDWARPDEWSAEAIDATIADRLGDGLDHVNGPFVKSCFAMCKDTILALAAAGPVLQDGVAFVPPVVIEVPEPTRAIFPYRRGTLPMDVLPTVETKILAVSFAKANPEERVLAVAVEDGTVLGVSGGRSARRDTRRAFSDAYRHHRGVSPRGPSQDRRMVELGNASPAVGDALMQSDQIRLRGDRALVIADTRRLDEYLPGLAVFAYSERQISDLEANIAQALGTDERRHSAYQSSRGMLGRQGAIDGLVGDLARTRMSLTAADQAIYLPAPTFL